MVAIVPPKAVAPPTAAAAEAEACGKPAETNMERLQQVRRRVAKAVHDEIQVVETAIKNDIKMVLGRIEAAEEFMRFNEFIHGGYRLQVQHLSECLLSLFMVHNETVNIWTHLFGLGVMVFLSVDTFMTVDFHHTADVVCFIAFFVCACIMFLFSSVYHTFGCYSDKVFNTVLTFDYLGIFSMILGSTLSAAHVLLYCHPFPRTVYQAAFLVACLGGATSVGLPYFQKEENRHIKLAIYSLTVAISVAPIAHAAYLYGPSEMVVWIIQLALYSIGAVVYITRFPESFFPGKFDLLFASHQLWHLFILLAGVWHYWCTLTVYKERLLSECKLPDAAA